VPSQICSLRAHDKEDSIRDAAIFMAKEDLLARPTSCGEQIQFRIEHVYAAPGLLRCTAALVTVSSLQGDRSRDTNSFTLSRAQTKWSSK